MSLFEKILSFVPGGESMLDIGHFLSGEKNGIQTVAGLTANAAAVGQLIAPSKANKLKNLAKLGELFGDGVQREDIDDIGRILSDGFVAHFGTKIFGDGYMGQLMSVGAGYLVSKLVENLLHEFAHISPEASAEKNRAAADKAIAKTMKQTADLTRTPEQMQVWEKHDLAVEMSAEEHKKAWVADYVRDHGKEYQTSPEALAAGEFELSPSQLKLAAEKGAEAKYAETFAGQTSFKRVMTKDEYVDAGMTRLGVYEKLDADGKVTNKAEIKENKKFLEQEYNKKWNLAVAEVKENGKAKDTKAKVDEKTADPKAPAKTDNQVKTNTAVGAGAAAAAGATTVTVTQNKPTNVAKPVVKDPVKAAADEIKKNFEANAAKATEEVGESAVNATPDTVTVKKDEAADRLDAFNKAQDASAKKNADRLKDFNSRQQQSEKENSEPKIDPNSPPHGSIDQNEINNLLKGTGVILNDPSPKEKESSLASITQDIQDKMSEVKDLDLAAIKRTKDVGVGRTANA